MRTHPTQEDQDVESTPERSSDQRKKDLARASMIRRKRAEIKRDLRTAQCSLHSLLLNPPEYLETAKVLDLLVEVPGFSRAKAQKMLTHVRVSPSKTVGGLSARQRAEFVALLRRDGSASVTRTDRLRAEGRSETEIAWELAIGRLLAWTDLSAVVGIPEKSLTQLRDDGSMIVLRATDGSERFPAFQFSDGSLLKSLATAHRILVEEGHASPWSAASWIASPHPDLDGLTPVQWTNAKRGDEHLLLTAKRDAARLAH